MAVPGFQSFMRPILELLSDGRPLAFAEMVETVADRMGLTEEDRAEQLPSGKQRRYANRIGWAKTHLAKAKLVETPRRGIVQITDRGRSMLAADEPIDVDALRAFPEYVEFKDGTGDSSDDATTANLDTNGDGDATPDERLAQLIGSLNGALAKELLEQLVAKEPAFFEGVVVKLLVKMGYGGTVKDAGKAIGKSGDGGIDGIIKQDRLGLDNVYIQAKRYQPGNSVGAGEVRNLAGALQIRRATKGVLITTSHFTDDAWSTAKQIGNIVLVDGKRLAELMIEFDLGVSTEATYQVKKIDQDFFDEVS